MKELAQRLGISHRTVQKHAQSIYRKTGVQTRIQLISLYVRNTGKRGSS